MQNAACLNVAVAVLIVVTDEVLALVALSELDFVVVGGDGNRSWNDILEKDV